ncbi:AIPR family protein [Limnoraphis robusta Tam1]|uniref:AIPR family protein n=1 Tax=Limnoraphis robusta TaxID=1118279 RepID=UPI002B20A617|nr:AIPR family protein [Limnoraphis robusta]MEA5537714.1 AIPR family protein [Limnoraphis robusta Tam1]
MPINITTPFFATAACKAYKEETDKESGRVIWNLTVPVCQVPKDLPLDPNARLANPKRRTVKSMLETLAQEPEEFIFYNNGILIVADSISVKGQGSGGGFNVELLLVSPDEEQEEKFIGNGIVNGGHTYMAIMKARENSEKLQAKRSKAKVNSETGKVDFSELDQASVQVFILVNVNQDNISKISRYRNTSEKVEEFSLKNLAQEWDIIDKHLPPEYKQYVAFRDGDDKPFDVTDVVRRLACINNKVYPWRSSSDGQPKNPMATCTAYGSLIKNWKKEDFEETVPLIKDILYIEDCLRSEYDQQKGFSRFKGVEKKNYRSMTGKEFEHSIPITFVFPILAAFRVFIQDGSWEKPVEELWNDMGSTLVNNLVNAYKTEGRSNPASFGRSASTWSNLLLVPMQLKLTQ